MQSLNFEFLRQNYPELADLGAFAERYVHSDPSSSGVKSRILAENIALRFCKKLGLSVYDDNFLTLLKELSSAGFNNRAVLNAFHQVRVAGNLGAHGGRQDKAQALETVKNVYALALWWMKTEHPDAILPEAFIPLSESTPSSSSQSVEEEKLRQELEAENARLRQENLKLTEQQKAAFLAEADKAADALKFDERTTRKRLIDAMLLQAGWDVNDADHVGIEVELDLPGRDTKGYSDYVLYDDDGTALAVIEAKKTAIDPQAGRVQAKLYADALEAADPAHVRPLIILTNGYETTLVDDTGGPASLRVKGYADRMIFGIPSKTSLNYRVKFQRKNMLDPATLPHRADIAGGPGREYQLEAIKSVAECFGEQRRRKALIVQATGTGKTRVAVTLTELLMQAKFAKRILFLCDRKELRKQAKNAFTQFLPDRSVKTLSRNNDFDADILIATYPAMQRRFQDFDIAHFDLIIADESHRSIYNKYRDIFLYFDALQLGLTATPVKQISRNTYAMFGCQNQDPTYFYEYERAIAEGVLVDFVPIEVTTKFMREGIHYSQLSEEEKRKLEEDGIEWEDVESSELDLKTYNKDTNRKILENLMQNGLRDRHENGVGKSIIFARNHKHALLLKELFQEMYPEYGPDYCAVIDNYISHAEDLLDDFKDADKNPVIAISVDMLDTGIDVPEVLNLVFAKPVKSSVKFWQMIGRGTRLCPNLIGDGLDKEKFYLFDHWGNCEYFELEKAKEDAKPSHSLMERLFEARIALAETALQKYDNAAFDQVIALLRQMINSLPDDSLPVKEKYRFKLAVLSGNSLEQFDAATVRTMRQELKPLMRYIPLIGAGARAAHGFDLLITEIQKEVFKKSSQLENLKGNLDNLLNSLPVNLDVIRAKFPDIKELKEEAFWQKPQEELVASLEAKRSALRGIMQYSQGQKPPDPLKARVIDVSDSDIIFKPRQPLRHSASEMAAYKKRVHDALAPHFQTDPVLIKLRRGEPITEQELERLASLILTQNAGVSLDLLREFYPVTENLLSALRGIVGMDAKAVRAKFARFHQKYPTLSAMQLQFLTMLHNYIEQNGPVQMQDLYEAPFTHINANGPDGIFTDVAQLDDLMAVIASFSGTPDLKSDFA